MFITKQWATKWGGTKSKENVIPFKRLPFYCCSLTFTPFEDPVCTDDGSVFNLMNIIPYIRKFGKHPVNGGPLKQDDLIPLTFHKNSDVLKDTVLHPWVICRLCAIISANGNTFGSMYVTVYYHNKLSVRVKCQNSPAVPKAAKESEVTLYGVMHSNRIKEISYICTPQSTEPPT